MRILQIYKDFYPPLHGGIEKHIHTLAGSLQRAGLEVEVLVSGDRYRADTYDGDGIRVTRSGQWLRVMSAPISPSFPFWLRRLAVDKDILHFHSPNPTAEFSFLLSGLKTPIVCSYHSDIVRQRIAGLLYQPWLRRFLQRTARIIAATPRHITMSPHLTALEHKCTVVPYGVDVQSFAPTPDMAQKATELRVMRGRPLILFVGKFRYYKGLPVLLKAMTQISANLMLVGDGPLESTLKGLVKELGLGNRVFFEGNVPESELPIYYHACDVLVLPSTHKSEGFGIVLLEAMACRKPVVTTELGTGTPYVNRDGETGLVVPPNDPAALAAALNRLVADSELCERLGAVGFEAVCREYSTEQMVRKTVGIYETILSCRSPKAAPASV